jgi:hypothetical protein
MALDLVHEAVACDVVDLDIVIDPGGSQSRLGPLGRPGEDAILAAVRSDHGARSSQSLGLRGFAIVGGNGIDASGQADEEREPAADTEADNANATIAVRPT